MGKQIRLGAEEVVKNSVQKLPEGGPEGQPERPDGHEPNKETDREVLPHCI